MLYKREKLRASGGPPVIGATKNSSRTTSTTITP